MESDTLITTQGGLGHIVLNRPNVLNALSADQYVVLTRTLSCWETDPAVSIIVIEGAGDRAFCAGGDIRMVWNAARRDDHAFNREVFRNEYRLNRRIYHYPKPYVSLLDGIVMGGGAGLSINGRYRVVTEFTRFAMPETGIGFFPDVGATHFLGACPGNVGLYLGLTGHQIGPADCLWAGIATHFVRRENLGHLRDAIAGAAASADSDGALAGILSHWHREPEEGPLSRRAETIERCFAPRRLADMVEALRVEDSQWAQDTVYDLSARSPFSLAVATRQLREGRSLTFDEAIAREYRVACRLLLGHDFMEGIRAQVVDKDRCPNWSPATLAEVEEGAVAACFASLGEDELPLP
ncbi:MAG: enoyl-CoA hydratase/isomerase family protein [Magnetospirillum sp.]|nr:enoyl-CoA hydratase/isomerase family protein [Magnetospirillum sp.]